MSNHTGITPVAPGQVSDGTAAVNAALYKLDAAIWSALEWTQAVALSDETTVITAEDSVVVMHYDGADVTLEAAFIGLSGQSTGGAVTVDMKRNGTSVFSVLPSIPAATDTSLTGTDAVVNGVVTLTRGDRISFDRASAGADAKGLKIYLSGRRPVTS